MNCGNEKDRRLSLENQLRLSFYHWITAVKNAWKNCWTIDFLCLMREIWKNWLHHANIIGIPQASCIEINKMK